MLKQLYVGANIPIRICRRRRMIGEKDQSVEQKCDADLTMDLGCIKKEELDLSSIPAWSEEEIKEEAFRIVKEEPIEQHQDLSWTEEEKPVSSKLNFPEARVVPERLGNIKVLSDHEVKLEIKDEPLDVLQEEKVVKDGSVKLKLDNQKKAQSAEQKCDADSTMDSGCIKKEELDLSSIPAWSEEEIKEAAFHIVKEEPIEQHQDLSWTEEEKPVSSKLNFPEARVVPEGLGNIKVLSDHEVKLEIKDEPLDVLQEEKVVKDGSVKLELDNRKKKVRCAAKGCPAAFNDPLGHDLCRSHAYCAISFSREPGQAPYMVWFPEPCTLCYELSSLLLNDDADDESLRAARAALRPWVSGFGRNAPSGAPYLLDGDMAFRLFPGSTTAAVPPETAAPLIEAVRATIPMEEEALLTEDASSLDLDVEHMDEQGLVW
ncbi:probable inactive protein kinase DDB_G0270444 [Palaemon carinicauda]|uniref:probable inactive protein kinase DDB_G0270444 n=1 Tax=Palaemon carinicauda TaxID=392227 RepID=UPI0035B6973A